MALPSTKISFAPWADEIKQQSVDAGQQSDENLHVPPTCKNENVIDLPQRSRSR
jgi:hypothetical protein